MALLVKDSRGSEVVKLKQQLNQKLSPSPNLNSSDLFDADTEAAVIIFQHLYRPTIGVDGKVGPDTQKALAATSVLHVHSFDESFLYFDGKALSWKVVGTLTWTERAQLVLGPDSSDRAIKYSASRGTTRSWPAVSGLKQGHKNNPQPGTDFTQPQYQNLSGVGPIPESFYYLVLTTNMGFEKWDGGWGIGGWALYDWDWTRRTLGTLEGYVGDLPGVRSGFFLHEDGGNDGTAGCIGMQRDGILQIRPMLVEYAQSGFDVITVRVKY